MTDVFDDVYWAEEFRITKADTERIASYIRRNDRAYDFTNLAKRVVRGRLRHGSESSAPVEISGVDASSVRTWDPAATWKIGDLAIVAASVIKGDKRVFVPSVGEITKMEKETVTLKIDSLEKSLSFSTIPKYSKDDLQKWRQFVEKLLDDWLGGDLMSHVDYIFMKHGERVASQLLAALISDERFIGLSGRWYLKELATLLGEERIEAIAHYMLRKNRPQLLEDIMTVVSAHLEQGDTGLFGLYLTMQNKSEQFSNIGREDKPQWILAGPPLGPFTAKCDAFDPETYDVLCQPGDEVSPEIVKRLWDEGLLHAVV